MKTTSKLVALAIATGVIVFDPLAASAQTVKQADPALVDA